MLEKIIKYKPRNSFEERLLKINIFIWNLVIYSIPLYLIENNMVSIPKQYIIFLAGIIYKLIEPFGEARVSGNVIEFNGITFLIDKTCSGYKSILSFFAIIFATPKEFKKKVKYFIMFSPMLFFFNIIRISSTILLSLYFNPFIVHNILWSVLTTLVVLILWYNFYKSW